MGLLNSQITFFKLKPHTRIALQSVVALCSIALVSGCSNSGNADGENPISTIVVKPDNDSSTPPSTNTPNPTNPPAQQVEVTDTSTESANVALDDADNTEQLQIPDDNLTNGSSASESQTSENVATIAVDGIPEDCIFDVAPSKETFCYQPKTRTLRAWQSNGAPWWAYDLPRTDATNRIHAIHVVNRKLHILAELKTDGVQTGFEVSTFAFGGAFEKTVAITKFQDYSFIPGHRIQVADIGDNLIIAGDYGLFSNNILPNESNGTFVAVFNTTSDKIENSLLYPQARQTNPMRVENGGIQLELEHLVYEITPSNLEPLEPIGQFQSIAFDRNNFIQKKRGLIGLVEKPPFKKLHAEMNEAFSAALRAKLTINPIAPADEPVNCSGGGTVEQSLIEDEFGSEVRTTTFVNCITSEFTANGLLIQRHTRYCGVGCKGLNSTLRALAFDITYINGDTWSIDGYINIKETRNTFSSITGEIEKPITEFENLTEFNVFSMSSDQLTIDLAQSRYQYDGTAKSGTGTWTGSGTLSYATGVSETFSVDVARELLDGAQVNFSGQLDAKRSDGTALFLSADSTELAQVLYTTTIGDSNVRTVSSW